MDTGFTFADVYDEVVSRAGGEQTTAEDVARVRRGLRLLLERWEAKGFNTWRFRYIDTRSPTIGNELTLPDRVDDVIHVVRAQGGTLERVPINEMMAFDFNRLDGTPGSWALLRNERPTLLLYPSGRAIDLRIWFVERPEDYQAGVTNMDDVPGRWLEAMILGLAHDFARKRPPYDEALIGRLKAEAAEAEDIAMRADRDRSRYRHRISI
jgi:hypothetical protein